jgi:16S rRNA (cytosine1402-N4)-methyltransferase
MHVPVMAERVATLFEPALAGSDAVVVDATVGLAGHAAVLLDRFPALHLVGLDRDPAALELSADRLARHGERVTLRHAVFADLPGVLAGAGLSRVDGVLFDLGVSSLQLDDPGRGFSYARDARLDMRMDQRSQAPSAADVLGSYSVAELTRVLRDYGEERYARRIAELVVRERERRPVRTSAELVDLIRRAIPAPARRTGGNPAKRTFQALRIEVNGELRALDAALPAGIAALRVGGRIVVLAYHSLEDRLVKRIFASGARVAAPDGLPVVPEVSRPTLRLLTRGAERPGSDEVAANPRAASARLRAAERLREAA